MYLCKRKRRAFVEVFWEERTASVARTGVITG